MRRKASRERESEHPLFRVLVLMGGSLALGCGGSAIVDGGGAGSGGTQAVGGAAQGGGGVGGSDVDAGKADCPPEQWNCSAIANSCLLNFQDNMRPSGCVCDLTRPRSIDDCAANEDLLCLQGYLAAPDPQGVNWDGYRRVQCNCVPLPTVPPADACQNACAKAYPWLVMPDSAIFVTCNPGPSLTCDANGNNCIPTSESVLRQDGITCGCASIVLK